MTELAFISDADLELVSAYLDNQLGPPERAALEARFAQEAALRQARDELGATITLLRELAPARPPRSFTLDPATTVPLRSAWQLPATWMRLGAAFASLMLALTFTFSTVNTANPASSISINQEAYDASSGAAATSAPAAAEATAAPAAGMTAAPAAAALELPAAPAPGITAAPASESAPLISADAAPASAAEAPAARAAESDTTGAAADTAIITAMEAEQPREVAPPTITLTILQITLAIATLVLLIGSFLVGRRM
ncbi:MAG: zf-HC2 domain-containing protein [Roseiflexaceae bacterium]|nr:zf-HC2 domain-containing protein [Roseiflexaceae bacterium]